MQSCPTCRGWRSVSPLAILRHVCCALAVFLPTDGMCRCLWSGVVVCPTHTLLRAPDYMDAPQQVQEYWGLVSRVAATQHPVIVRRGELAVAAVIPVAYLELLREFLAQQEAEQHAAQVDWRRWPGSRLPPSHGLKGRSRSRSEGTQGTPMPGVLQLGRIVWATIVVCLSTAYHRQRRGWSQATSTRARWPVERQ